MKRGAVILNASQKQCRVVVRVHRTPSERTERPIHEVRALMRVVAVLRACRDRNRDGHAVPVSVLESPQLSLYKDLSQLDEQAHN